LLFFTHVCCLTCIFVVLFPRLLQRSQICGGIIFFRRVGFGDQKLLFAVVSWGEKVYVAGRYNFSNFGHNSDRQLQIFDGMLRSLILLLFFYKWGFSAPYFAFLDKNFCTRFFYSLKFCGERTSDPLCPLWWPRHQ